MTPQRFIIYCHTNKVNGKKYVGQTVQTMQARWRQHRSYALKGKKHCDAFYNAIRKYGPDAFTHEILDVVTTREGANTAKTVWIAQCQCRAPYGYNIDSGGGFQRRHPNTVAKIKAAWTPEKQALINEKVSAAWTPERRKQQSERSRRQNEINGERLRESTRRWFAGMTPEQRHAFSEASKVSRAAQLSASTHEQRSEAAKRWLTKKTPEQRRERVLKAWADRTPEQREAVLSKTRELRIATLKRVAAERRAKREKTKE